jgi:hypothetical protein
VEGGFLWPTIASCHARSDEPAAAKRNEFQLSKLPDTGTEWGLSGLKARLRIG